MEKNGDFLTKAGKAFDRVIDICAVLAGIIAAFVTLAVCAGILTRFLLNRPMAWVMEISEYSLLYMAFLAAAWVMKHNQHVALDLVYNRLSDKKKAVADFFTSIVGALVFLIIVIYGTKVTYSEYATKYFTPTFLEVPKFLVTIIIPIGSLLLLIQILRKIYRIANFLLKKDYSQLKGPETGLQVEP